jgi:hypothetical protein
MWHYMRKGRRDVRLARFEQFQRYADSLVEKRWRARVWMRSQGMQSRPEWSDVLRQAVAA